MIQRRRKLSNIGVCVGGGGSGAKPARPTLIFPFCGGGGGGWGGYCKMYIHTCMHKYMYAHMYMLLNVHIPLHACTCTHACMHVHITHAFIHLHADMNI